MGPVISDGQVHSRQNHAFVEKHRLKVAFAGPTFFSPQFDVPVLVRLSLTKFCEPELKKEPTLWPVAAYLLFGARHLPDQG